MTNEKETMEMLQVPADCQKKKKCDYVFNSTACKLMYFTANCPHRALKDKQREETKGEQK